jgi:hypothetical protein
MRTEINMINNKMFIISRQILIGQITKLSNGQTSRDNSNQQRIF